MIPRFSLARPRTVEEALAEFAAGNGDGEAAYLAGGTELLQVMKMGLAPYATLVDLTGLEPLRGVAVEPDGMLVIGALTTHREIERSPLVRERVPALAGLARHVANVRVRSTGTLGGNLAFAEPHSDPATFLLACGASVELIGPGGQRDVPVAEFFVGPLTTVREPDEIVVRVRLPAAGAGEGRAYRKLAFFERPAASVAASLRIEAGAISGATISVGSCTETPVVLDDAGAALAGAEARPEALQAALGGLDRGLDGLDLVADLNGSVDYKRHLVGVLVARATGAALAEAMERD